jgi:hypothetical protein
MGDVGRDSRSRCRLVERCAPTTTPSFPEGATARPRSGDGDVPGAVREQGGTCSFPLDCRRLPVRIHVASNSRTVTYTSWHVSAILSPSPWCLDSSWVEYMPRILHRKVPCVESVSAES